MEIQLLYMLKTLIALQLSTHNWLGLLVDHVAHDKEISRAMEGLWEAGD